MKASIGVSALGILLYITAAFICATFDISEMPSHIRGNIGAIFIIVSSGIVLFCTLEEKINKKEN